MNDAIRMIREAGGAVESVGILPDGSGFATGTFPLPADHWLTAPGENVPPMPWKTGVGPFRTEKAQQIRDAARYAIRASTDNGSENDFDPDAMVQNLIVGLLGYWTVDGDSHADECLRAEAGR